MPQFRFLSNFAAGTFAGTFGAFSVAWLVDIEVAQWINANLATLFTGLASIGAAALALMGVLSQVSLQENHRHEERLASLRAARSVLPLALAELHEICNNRIAQTFENAKETSSIHLSAQSLGVLKECIQNSDEVIANRIEEIIIIYQILSARNNSSFEFGYDRKSADFSDLEDKYPNGICGGAMEQHRRIVEWFQLRAINDCLFAYARGGHLVNREDKEVRSRVISGLDFFTLSDRTHIADFPRIRIVRDRLAKQTDDIFDLHFANPLWQSQ